MNFALFFFFFAVPNIESYPPIEAIVIGDQLQLLQLPESDIKVQSKQEEASETYCNISRFNTLEVAYNDEIFVTTNTSSTVLFEISNTNKVVGTMVHDTTGKLYD